MCIWGYILRLTRISSKMYERGSFYTTTPYQLENIWVRRILVGGGLEVTKIVPNRNGISKNKKLYIKNNFN